MAEQTKIEAPAADAVVVKKLKKKKSRPTNCAQSNKRIRRKDWYYRNGKFFANKQCFVLFAEQEAKKRKDEAAKAEEAAKAAKAAQATAAAASAETESKSA